MNRVEVVLHWTTGATFEDSDARDRLEWALDNIAGPLSMAGVIGLLLFLVTHQTATEVAGVSLCGAGSVVYLVFLVLEYRAEVRRELEEKGHE